jgi:hypothetical protein
MFSSEWNLSQRKRELDVRIGGKLEPQKTPMRGEYPWAPSRTSR